MEGRRRLGLLLKASWWERLRGEQRWTWGEEVEDMERGRGGGSGRREGRGGGGLEAVFAAAFALAAFDFPLNLVFFLSSFFFSVVFSAGPCLLTAFVAFVARDRGSDRGGARIEEERGEEREVERRRSIGGGGEG